MNLKLISTSSAATDDTDVNADWEVLHSSPLSAGQKTEEFEARVAEYIGVQHAVAVRCGSAALHLIAIALGLRPGDEVLVPSFAAEASVNAILFVGATPVFVDIQPDTYNLDPDDARRKITSRTKAILGVDVFGHPAEWDGIEALAHRYGLRIIDNACEALGAQYQGRKIGQFGDAAALGFYPDNPMETGESGMLVTNDQYIAEIARTLRNQGQCAAGGLADQDRPGYNYLIDEMSAAQGCSQVQRIETLQYQRECAARFYEDRLQDVGWLQTPTPRADARTSWSAYVVTLAPGLPRDRVIKVMDSAGIPARAPLSPVHQQPYIVERFGNRVWSLPVTESIANNTLALPFHSHLTETEVDQVVGALKTCFVRAAA